jgi:hypothetical protein
MKKTKTPPTSSESTNSIHDPPGYIQPSLQDMLFTDITAEELLVVAERLEVQYLSPAATFPGSFPAYGVIYGLNKRLMVNLVCRRHGKTATPLNVIFLIDTGSPVSYLSAKAMESLIGNAGSSIVNQLPVMIHSENVIACHLSPRDKHFADVNVLGMDFLSDNLLSLSMNYKAKTFELVE